MFSSYVVLVFEIDSTQLFARGYQFLSMAQPVAMFPISTPPDDLCLYHCISYARDPGLYMSVPRSDAGHFVGDRALQMTQRARSIRDELIALLRVSGMLLVLSRGPRVFLVEMEKHLSGFPAQNLVNGCSHH